MKNSILLLLAFIVTASYAQTECKPYVPYTKGSKWEITNYSPKGKETGKIAYELIDKVETENGITFTIKTTTYDKKGKETYSGQYEAYCVDGKFDFNMAFKMDAAVMQANSGMDVDIDASEFEIPTMEAPAGSTLKDASMVMTVTSNGMGMFTMTILITERKVEAKEDITTPAGTFNCLTLYQKVSTKMFMNIVSYSKEWYAEGIGMVRSETYDKNKKLTGYSELTKLETK